MTAVAHHRPIRSYVLRQGKMTPGQLRAYDTLMATYGLHKAEGVADCDDAILEIGFGMGASLLELATKNPQQQYIGVEVHKPGVGRLLLGAKESNCNNLRVYRDDAIDVLTQCIPDSLLKGVLIFFPDPWHKKKHNKRRLIQPGFVSLLAHKIKQGGVLHIATDWEHYAEHIIEVMSLRSEFENTAGDKFFVPRPASRPHTKYEARGERLGHGVWDMVFKRK